MPSKVRTILLPKDFDAWFAKVAKDEGLSWENGAREALLEWAKKRAKSATAAENSDPKTPKP